MVFKKGFHCNSFFLQWLNTVLNNFYNSFSDSPFVSTLWLQASWFENVTFNLQLPCNKIRFGTAQFEAVVLLKESAICIILFDISVFY